MVWPNDAPLPCCVRPPDALRRDPEQKDRQACRSQPVRGVCVLLQTGTRPPPSRRGMSVILRRDRGGRVLLRRVVLRVLLRRVGKGRVGGGRDRGGYLPPEGDILLEGHLLLALPF